MGAACRDAGVSQESHDELRAEVREVKSEVKGLQREISHVARQSEGAGHGAAPSGDTGGHAAEDSAAEDSGDHGASEGSGDHGGPPRWAYSGTEGPSHWGDLSPDFAVCSSGANQSPIDLASTTPVGAAQIVFNYGSTALTVINNGHTILANVEAGNTITLEGVPYELAQFHFHAPSEHTVAGKHFAMEMHFVHVGASGDLAVVGMLFDRGPVSGPLASVWAVLPSDTELQGEVDGFDLATLLPGDRGVYRYSGSLTTPPCSEGVKWMMLQTPASASADQVQAFDDIIGANNRPVQPVNARELLAETGAELAFSAR